MSAEAQLTPMMAQYRRIKSELPKDALLLFRLGDFYEMFFEDAQAGSQLLNLSLTARNGFTAFDRLAITVDGPGTEIALGIRERLVELDREGMSEIVEHILARGDIDLDVAPVLGRDYGEPPLHQGLAC